MTGGPRGPDDTPPNIWKYDGPALKTNCFNIWLTTVDVHQDFNDAAIVTIYKGKIDRTKCGNHIKIALLSIARKLLAKILQFWLQIMRHPALESVWVQNQQIHSWYETFVDFSMAFDIVHRETLWKILSLYDCLKTFIRVIQSFHDGMAASICCDDGCLDPFSVRHNVKQRCHLAPILFTIFLAAVLKNMWVDLDDLYIWTKSDGDLFSIRCL